MRLSVKARQHSRIGERRVMASRYTLLLRIRRRTRRHGRSETSMAEQPGKIDVLIFGGGAAGLWLLDDLIRAGEDVLLLEAGDLGGGQTIASQGIIHGGLKYTLSGLFTPAARAIRDMPLVWRRCLAGECNGGPDLRGTRLRAEFCHLWRTSSIGSRLAMIGARAGLRVAPIALDEGERPTALAATPGIVARLDEQVIEPASFLADLSSQHRGRILQIDAGSGLEFALSAPGQIDLVRLINPETGEPLDLAPRHVALLAGEGNEALRRRAGLQADAMQLRPLHMVMARGDAGALPPINGHCVDGPRTRVTITTTHDVADRTVWQIGGQIAEDGVGLDAPALIARARGELAEVLPGVSLEGVSWATYTAARAEAAAAGRRPESAAMLREGNVVTGWPTKMALAPHLSAMIRAEIGVHGSARAARADPDRSFHNWPRPPIALPPCESCATWYADL
jgi:hypothetical protein